MESSRPVVIINARNIFPYDGGDKIVSFNLLKKISQVSEVVYINIVDERRYTLKEENAIRHFSKEFHCFEERLVRSPFDRLLSILFFKPFVVFRRTRRKGIAKNIVKIISQCKPSVVIWDQLRSPVYYLPNNRKNFIIEHNDEVQVYYEKADNKNWLARKVIFQQAKLLDAFSSNIHRQFDKIVYLSIVDQKITCDPKFTSFKRLLISFQHQKYAVAKSSETVNLLFVGSLDWYPNYNGITWFIQKVMPLLPENFRLTVVGRSAPEAIFQMGDSKVSVHSNVPSVEEYFLKADVFISPIFVGSGINIKILEASSYGIPIVATPHSIRGYDGLNSPQANDETSFCQQLVKLESYEERLTLNQETMNWYNDYQRQITVEISKLLYN